ncbi:immunoglobulin i-set domain-containing protein [Ditylenchus destructor]|nr:immunoglobulin i-set domain-containing protein [Ditylenchus destructor]
MPFKRPLGERAENRVAPTFIRPLQDKRVIVGQKVLLECQIEGHPDPVIKWLKDGQNVTQCPDYEVIEEKNKHCLLIYSAAGSDCGRFTIQAMNAAGIKQSTCMLIVAPAPTPIPGAISIASSPGPGPQTPVGPSAPFFLKDLKHQPHRSGAACVLEARVVGQPVPQIEWLKDGQNLDNYRAKTEYDPQSGICMLTIPQMFPEDLGEYTLKASNNIGMTSSSAHIMPREQFEKWFSDERQQVTQERKQKILAKTGAQPPQSPPQQQRRQQPQAPLGRNTPQYIQRQLMQGSPHLQQQQRQYGNTAGVFSPPTISDGESQHVWIAGVSESETDTDVGGHRQPPPLMAPIFRSELRGLRLTEGTDAILQCSVVGVPKPKITWFKNGQQINISPKNPRTIAQYSGSLALLKVSMVRPEDSGQYTIFAENSSGKSQTLGFSNKKDLNLVSLDMCKVKKQTVAGWLNQGGKSVPRLICFSAKLAPSSGIVLILLYEKID